MNKLFCCYKVKEGRRGEGGRKERREERKKKIGSQQKGALSLPTLRGGSGGQQRLKL